MKWLRMEGKAPVCDLCHIPMRDTVSSTSVDPVGRARTTVVCPFCASQITVLSLTKWKERFEDMVADRARRAEGGNGPQ